MHVLVLGGTGLLGQAVSRVARSRGYTVTTAARRDGDVRIDVSDLNAIRVLMGIRSFELVFNCVAITDLAACEHDPGSAYVTNARPLSVLAQECARRRIKLCHVSTDHYYVGGGRSPHSEDEPVILLNEYARSKYAAEAFALTYSQALVLRTSIVGIRGWSTPTLAEWAIAALEEDRPATLFSDAFTSSIDTDSFSEAAFDLLDANASGLLNLAAGEIYSKEEFVLALANALHRSPTRMRSGSVDSGGSIRAKSLGLDVSRASTILDRPLPRLSSIVDSVLRQRS